MKIEHTKCPSFKQRFVTSNSIQKAAIREYLSMIEEDFVVSEMCPATKKWLVATGEDAVSFTKQYIRLTGADISIKDFQKQKEALIKKYFNNAVEVNEQTLLMLKTKIKNILKID